MAGKKDKTTLAAEKARKQKIIVIAGGVILLGLAAIQGPKLWKQLNPPSPAAKAAASASVTPATSTAPSQAAPAGSSSTGTATVVVAGVSISAGGTAPRSTDGKLVSFSLFKAKDPFVPQADDGTSGSGAPGSTPSGSTGTSSAGASSSGSSQGTAPDNGSSASAGTASAPPAKPTFATIEVNDKAQQVALKDTFPAKSPTFALAALTRSQAKIGVAGGSFESGKTMELPMKKEVTVVDTATGVRYTLKLVYAGTAPETVESFTSAPKPAQASKP